MITERAIAMVRRSLALEETAGAGRIIRASVCTVLGAGLMALGLRRKGAVGGVLAAAGAASLFRGASDWLSQQEQEGSAWLGTEQGSSGKAGTEIECSLSDAYGFCRELRNLQSIVPQAVLPAGSPASSAGEWNSDLLEAREGELLVWRIRRGDIEHLGRMTFQPATHGRGTAVEFWIWRPPPSDTRSDLQIDAEEMLRRLKVVLETRAGGVPSPLDETGLTFTTGALQSPADGADEAGRAPESGEPGDTRRVFERRDVSSVAGDDVGYAPESGDRVADRTDEKARIEQIEESAGEHRVLQGSEESFPASDAPSWTPGRA